MSVTLAPELTEAIKEEAIKEEAIKEEAIKESAIKESADRQGLSLDDWISAAAELKFRADDEAAISGEAERKRRAAALQEYLDEYQAEFGAFTEGRGLPAPYGKNR